jgi:hypothetical protein
MSLHHSRQSPPDHQIGHSDPPDSRQSLVEDIWPPLVLKLEAVEAPALAAFPVMRDQPIFRDVEPEDNFYPLAEWAWKHGPKLPTVERQSFLKALALLWPRSDRGDRKNSFMRHLYAWRLNEAGATKQQIAEAFSVESETVRKWLKAGAKIAAGFTSEGYEPRVVVAFASPRQPDPYGYSTAEMLYDQSVSRDVRRQRGEDEAHVLEVALAIGAVENSDELSSWLMNWGDDAQP